MLRKDTFLRVVQNPEALTRGDNDLYLLLITDVLLLIFCYWFCSMALLLKKEVKNSQVKVVVHVLTDSVRFC